MLTCLGTCWLAFLLESVVKQVASPTRKQNIFLFFSTYTGFDYLSLSVIARVLSDPYPRLEELIDQNALFLKIFFLTLLPFFPNPEGSIAKVK